MRGQRPAHNLQFGAASTIAEVGHGFSNYFWLAAELFTTEARRRDRIQRGVSVHPFLLGRTIGQLLKMTWLSQSRAVPPRSESIAMWTGIRDLPVFHHSKRAQSTQTMSTG